MQSQALTAGQLTERVTLLAPTESRGADFGDPQIVWSQLATVWAAVEPLTGREYFANREQQAAIDVRVRIRYRDDVTSKCRVQHRGKVYEIASVIEPLSTREQLQLMCVEYRNG